MADRCTSVEEKTLTFAKGNEDRLSRNSASRRFRLPVHTTTKVGSKVFKVREEIAFSDAKPFELFAKQLLRSIIDYELSQVLVTGISIH